MFYSLCWILFGKDKRPIHLSVGRSKPLPYILFILYNLLQLFVSNIEEPFELDVAAANIVDALGVFALDPHDDGILIGFAGLDTLTGVGKNSGLIIPLGDLKRFVGKAPCSAALPQPFRSLPRWEHCNSRELLS